MQRGANTKGQRKERGDVITEMSGAQSFLTTWRKHGHNKWLRTYPHSCLSTTFSVEIGSHLLQNIWNWEELWWGDRGGVAGTGMGFDPDRHIYVQILREFTCFCIEHRRRLRQRINTYGWTLWSTFEPPPQAVSALGLRAQRLLFWLNMPAQICLRFNNMKNNSKKTYPVTSLSAGPIVNGLRAAVGFYQAVGCIGLNRG